MRINKAHLLLKNQNSIVLIDEAHNHFHHDIFLLGPTFGNHECESDKRVIGSN